MKRWIILLLTLGLMLIITAGCDASFTQSETTEEAVDDVNFRLLISDEPNLINDFTELNVTISSIGVHQGGESGSWLEWELDPEETVPLTELQGKKSTELWSGQLDDGTYTKVFIYIEDVEGNLDGNDVTVKLPGGKLHISKTFEVIDGEVTEFVFDITVIKAGNSDKYILKPQITESGPKQEFEEVDAKGNQDKAGESKKYYFYGVIDEIVDENTWTMTIEEETRTIDVGKAKIEGNPGIGAEVKIKGTVAEDDSIIASKVEIGGSED